MHYKAHIYKAPRVTPAPLAARGSECPFCSASGWVAPGPCSRCNVMGYHNGTPPGVQRGSKAAQISDDHLDDHLDDVLDLDLDDQLDQEAA